MSSSNVARVGIRRDQVIVLGRYLYVFRPVLDSILDTIFWGAGFKSVAHVLLLSYLSYHHLCGIRFMFLFTMFHFFLKAGKRQECTEEEAIFQFKMTLQDLTIVMKRYNPTLHHIWPVLLLIALAASVLEVILEQSIVAMIDASIGPLTVVVIMICYGLVDPRYTRNYRTPGSGLHSRSDSQQPAILTTNGAVTNASKGSINDSLFSPTLLSPKLEPFSPAEPPAIRPLSNGSGSDLSPVYTPGDTPSGPWDELMPPCSTLPDFVHKVLMIYTKGPQWKDWKISPEYIARDHPIAWTVVKCGLNVAQIKNVTFDDAVAFIDDDPKFLKPQEALSVWKFDKLVGEFRRLKIVDDYTRVVHMVYRQIVFGIAPRDAPMYQFAKELTREEIDYYGLCRAHANNANVTDGVGRVFVQSSAPAEGVPLVKGHVRCIVHRQAIIIREIPSTNSIEMMTIICGEPGGKVPARIVDMTRGEQLKVVVAMRKAMLAAVEEGKKKK